MSAGFVYTTVGLVNVRMGEAADRDIVGTRCPQLIINCIFERPHHCAGCLCSKIRKALRVNSNQLFIEYNNSRFVM